jgi:hypothetical protein
MKAFTDRELIDFLAGRLTADAREAIAAQLDTDEELAARVFLMAGLGGFALPQKETVQTSRIRRLLMRLTKLSVATVLVCLFGAGAIGFAAWSILHERPLLEDKFNDDWLDPRLWRTARRQVREENGHLRLINRGSVVTEQEFDGPISLRFKWRWLDLVGDSDYRDTLTVALRTSGKHKPAHSFEILDGITVTFQAHSGQISIVERSIPNKPYETEYAKLPMPADAWHDIRIDDDGETISVFIAGPSIDPKYWQAPAIQFRPKARYEQFHIAIYNREVVANAPHEANIDDFVLTRLRIPTRTDAK